MSDDEGRVAFKAWYAQPSRSYLDHQSWQRLSDIQREEWAAVERAVRADERRRNHCEPHQDDSDCDGCPPCMAVQIDDLKREIGKVRREEVEPLGGWIRHQGQHANTCYSRTAILDANGEVAGVSHCSCGKLQALAVFTRALARATAREGEG